MKVLIVGSGAREHAIAWRLNTSPRVTELFAVPGNAGTSTLCTNLSDPSDGMVGLARLAEEHGIDLTIVGPETPLAGGIVDRFKARGLPVFGPTQAAARIESSKAFARELMERHDVPGPDFNIFRAYDEARAFLSSHRGPVVVKADGLAAGKGALVCRGKEDALEALYQCMEARTFGEAGDTVVVEELMEGREVSVFAFCDGENISPLVAACDYKRLLDGDEGPITGGMGSYSPPEFWTPQLGERIRSEIMAPVIRALAADGCPYQGVLYAGLMLTSEGPKVLEFNCRFGDPEAQVILPLLRTDLVDAVQACIEGGLADMPVQWEEGASVGVVMASGGYPGAYSRGLPIVGLEDVDTDALIFHAGTRREGDGESGRVLTDGGRVLTVVGRGAALAEARENAYDNIRRLHIQDAHYRTDIAPVERAVRL